MKYSNVIFDMDGVIVDSMPFHYEAWAEALKSENINISELEVYKREGERGQVTAHDLLVKNKIKPTVSKKKDLLSLKEKIFKKIFEIKMFDGVEDFILSLNEQGRRMAIVTGTSRSEVNKILPSSIRRLFDVIVTGSDVIKGKPDPYPYKLALEKLKASKEDTIVIENAPYGIISAKKAGLTCVAIASSLPESYLKEADFVFSSIQNVRDFITKL